MGAGVSRSACARSSIKRGDCPLQHQMDEVANIDALYHILVYRKATRFVRGGVCAISAAVLTSEEVCFKSSCIVSQCLGYCGHNSNNYLSMCFSMQHRFCFCTATAAHKMYIGRSVGRKSGHRGYHVVREATLNLYEATERLVASFVQFVRSSALLARRDSVRERSPGTLLENFCVELGEYCLEL
jgi:hypothetical protein